MKVVLKPLIAVYSELLRVHLRASDWSIDFIYRVFPWFTLMPSGEVGRMSVSAHLYSEIMVLIWGHIYSSHFALILFVVFVSCL